MRGPPATGEPPGGPGHWFSEIYYYPIGLSYIWPDVKELEAYNGTRRGIQALTVTGFRVGSDCVVNAGPSNYFWVAFSGAATSSSDPPRIIRWAEVDPFGP